MKLAERLDKLEDAHRALSARHDALFQICKVTLPIALSSNGAMVRRLLTSCYDITTEHMDKDGKDDEYQSMVHAAMDELSNVLVYADTHPRRQTPDASAPRSP
jgi:hypothetical protein